MRNDKRNFNFISKIGNIDLEFLKGRKRNKLQAINAFITTNTSENQMYCVIYTNLQKKSLGIYGL